MGHTKQCKGTSVVASIDISVVLYNTIQKTCLRGYGSREVSIMETNHSWGYEGISEILSSQRNQHASFDRWLLQQHKTLRYAPLAERRITLDRFQDIAWGSPNDDHLGKVHPFINHTRQLTELYNAHKELAVDEAMIKFQGWSSLKQYCPLKLVKCGTKVWGWQTATTGTFSREGYKESHMIMIAHRTRKAQAKQMLKNLQDVLNVSINYIKCKPFTYWFAPAPYANVNASS